MVRRNSLSNKYISSRGLPPVTYKWVHKARLDVLSTRSSIHKRHILDEGYSLSCSQWAQEQESLRHILNKYIIPKQLQTVRHDTIFNKLANLVVRTEETVIRVNKDCQYNDSYRPDLLIQNNGLSTG
ncbi:hypothetical protein RF11_01119 [Thelohanellus kitauei]|uniref:Uncharacterized protein n=1 Tax=Thelohanellus kitauei TaxID=669202 RepID=A0A0C2MY72_THEKT|nr:hypothetical protein RF11_01119 [Thelohanellus kitauei]